MTTLPIIWHKIHWLLACKNTKICRETRDPAARVKTELVIETRLTQFSINHKSDSKPIGGTCSFWRKASYADDETGNRSGRRTGPDPSADRRTWTDNQPAQQSWPARRPE